MICFFLNYSLFAFSKQHFLQFSFLKLYEHKVDSNYYPNLFDQLKLPYKAK